MDKYLALRNYLNGADYLNGISKRIAAVQNKSQNITPFAHEAGHQIYRNPQTPQPVQPINAAHELGHLQPQAVPQKKTDQLLKGYNANGSTTYFDDELEEQFKNLRNSTYSPNQYWQSGEGIDNDLYSALYNADLPENSPLNRSMGEWTDNDWDAAKKLFMNSSQIRQDRLDRMKKYWDGISDVTPVYKKGGSLKQDYRAWEKEMYDSYKCGGKTKKKCCGGTMRGKKKACGGMKVKK